MWASGEEGTMIQVQITIGGTEIYTLVENRGSLSYYALLDYNINIDKTSKAGLKETINFMDGESVIGTLEIKVSDTISDGVFPDMRGTFVGVGTGALKSVKVSGTDSFDAGAIVRAGSIMNWPGLP